MLLPTTFAALLTESIALHVATRDASLVPECVRAWGPLVLPDQASMTVYVPRSYARRTLENLNDNARIAITITRLADYRTVQVKGTALGWRDARPAEHAPLAAHKARFVAGAAEEGLADAVARWAFWPAVAIDVAIEELYNQTPRPGTGARVAP